MSDINNTTERLAEGATYVGAGAATIAFGLNVEELAVVAGACFAGLSFVIHTYFSWRRDRREHRAFLAAHPEPKEDDISVD